MFKKLLYRLTHSEETQRDEVRRWENAWRESMRKEVAAVTNKSSEYYRIINNRMDNVGADIERDLKYNKFAAETGGLLYLELLAILTPRPPSK